MDNSESDLVLHLSIVERLAFLGLKAARLIQNIISQIWWSTIGKFALCITFRAFGKRGKNYRYITFKRERLIQIIFGKILYGIIYTNSILNGLRGNYHYYNFLLRWNPAIPLIALKNNSSSGYIIHWLGEADRELKDHYKIEQEMMLGTSKSSGYFRITKKYVSPDAPVSVKIKCVWISGEETGNEFVVTQFGPVEDNGENIPDSIYFPPIGIVWCLEAIAGLSFVTVFVGLIIKCWNELGLTALLDGIIYNIL